MSLTITTDNQAHAIDLATVREYCAVNEGSDDATLQLLAGAAGRDIERISNRTLMEKTYKLNLHEFPSDGRAIELKRPPVSSVTSVVYTDEAGDSQTWAS